MTVTSTNQKVQFNGNGSTTVFAYNFKIFASSDLSVILRSAAGTETVQQLTTNYTVSGVGEASGGNVTMGTAPASGTTLVIQRVQPQLQGLDLVPNDPFPAQSMEDALDKLVFNVQSLNEEVGRAIKASTTNTIGDTEFTTSATDRANKLFSFDGSGNLQISQELGTYKGDWAASTVYAVRDLVKDTSTNNIFIAVTAHTSSGSQPLTTNTDSAKWALIVDAATATTSASTATTKASEAAASATLASQWAIKTDGTVDGTNYSAKYWATQADVAAVAGVATEIGRLGTSDAVADMAILGTSDVVADMNTLGTAAIVEDMNLLGTSANVTAMGLLGNSTVIADMAILGTSDIVADMAILGTSDVVSDMNTLATSDIVSDMNTLATSANVTAMSTVATNIASVNNFDARYRVSSSAPSSSLDVGDLWWNTSDNTINVYASGQWNSAILNSAGFQPLGGTTNYEIFGFYKFSDTNGVTFRDSAIQIFSSADGQLDIDADGEVEITTALLDVNGALDVSGNITVGGTVDGIDLQTLNTAVTANTAKTTNATHTGDVTGSGALTIADNAVTTAKINADAVTNAKLADNSVDSEQYVDGSIDTAHIADANVTQAKIAGEAINESKLQVSNAPTNGYALTAQSGNTGGLTWAAISGGGGGAMEFIASSGAISNGTASVAFTGFDASKYDSYKFYFLNVVPVNDGVVWASRVSVNGGSSYDGTNGSYYTTQNYSYLELATSVGGASGDTTGVSGELTAFNPQYTGGHRLFLTAITKENTSAQYVHDVDAKAYINNEGTAINAIQFFYYLDSIESGEITMYGIKNA